MKEESPRDKGYREWGELYDTLVEDKESDIIPKHLIPIAKVMHGCAEEFTDGMGYYGSVKTFIDWCEKMYNLKVKK